MSNTVTAAPPVTEIKNLFGGETKVLDKRDGVVEAIISVTGIKDEVDDIIKPGAYAKTLAARRPKGIRSHDWNRPAMKTLAIDELHPGDPGLPSRTARGERWPRSAGATKVLMQFNLETTDGKEGFSNVKFYGPEQEWSIGYNVPRGEARMVKGIREIDGLDLYEYSDVLFGAMPLAGTQNIKAHGGIVAYTPQLWTPIPDRPDRLDRIKASFRGAVGRVAGGFSTFNPADHPRDSLGRFRDKLGVRLPDGTPGIAVGVTTDGMVRVDTGRAATTNVSPDKLVDAPDVTKRPEPDRATSPVYISDPTGIYAGGFAANLEEEMPLADMSHDELSAHAQRLSDLMDDFAEGTTVRQVLTDRRAWAIQRMTEMEAEADEVRDALQGEFAIRDMDEAGLRAQRAAVMEEYGRADLQPGPYAEVLRARIDEIDAALDALRPKTGLEDTPQEELVALVDRLDKTALTEFARRLTGKSRPAGEDKRKFTQAERDRAPTQPGTEGSFPIANVEDLDNAIRAVGRAKDPAGARRWIIRRARELNALSHLPASWRVEKAADEPGEAKDLGEPPLTLEEVDEADDLWAFVR